MDMAKSQVYVKPDFSGYITRVDGGYTVNNIKDPKNWVMIDEGYGDKYNLCQGNYFDKTIMTAGGAYRYKLVDGKPVECTAEEIAKQEAALQPEKPIAVPTVWDELDAAYQSGYTEGYQEGVNSAYDQ